MKKTMALSGVNAKKDKEDDIIVADNAIIFSVKMIGKVFEGKSFKVISGVTKGTLHVLVNKETGKVKKIGYVFLKIDSAKDSPNLISIYVKVQRKFNATRTKQLLVTLALHNPKELSKHAAGILRRSFAKAISAQTKCNS